MKTTINKELIEIMKEQCNNMLKIVKVLEKTKNLFERKEISLEQITTIYQTFAPCYILPNAWPSRILEKLGEEGYQKEIKKELGEEYESILDCFVDCPGYSIKDIIGISNFDEKLFYDIVYWIGYATHLFQIESTRKGIVFEGIL